MLKTEEGRTCKKCGIFKSWDNYSEKNPTNRPKGKQPRCKPCATQDTRDWYQNNKDRAFESRLRKEYNITIDEYDELVAKAFSKCQICHVDLKFKTSPPTSDAGVVDHCHTTGKIRGILCNSCNRGIGYFRDNPMFLTNAAKYLIETDPSSKGGQ